MKEQWILYRDKFVDYWKNLSKKQKILLIGTFSFLFISMIIFIYVAAQPKYVPLYTSELSTAEIGQVKSELDNQGYTNYKLSETGRSILVPKKDASGLVVDLAAQGLPKEGNISYEVFSENMNFGATDRQLDVIERDAMQNELRNLVKQVEGIQNADVMISLPEETVFMRAEDQGSATASIIVSVEPGISLDNSQIRSLYFLVSKSVPDLPMENIVIMNQRSEMLELNEDDSDMQAIAQYQEQREIRRQIERDIQNDLQRMLGTIMGPERVLVHTFVKMNFDQVRTQEELVEPVNETTNQGIAVSVEEITESYQGSAAGAPGGVAGAGEGDVPGYQAQDGQGQNVEYENLENRINYEVDRISNEIIQSPYEIEDITINVGVEPPTPDDIESLTADTQNNIQNVISNVVRTALTSDGETLTEAEINERISVFPRTFTGNQDPFADEEGMNTAWFYALGAVAALSLGGMAFMVLRRRRTADTAAVSTEAEEAVPQQAEVPPMQFDDQSEEAVMKKQLEGMAKDRPEDFANLLRSWLADQ